LDKDSIRAVRVNANHCFIGAFIMLNGDRSKRFAT
jgi:hypothetical protein